MPIANLACNRTGLERRAFLWSEPDHAKGESASPMRSAACFRTVRRHLIFWTSIWRIRSQQLAGMIPRIALVARKIVFFVP